MALWKEVFSMVTLGLLCGWYFFILFLIPTLVLACVYGSLLVRYSAGTTLALLVALSVTKLDFTPRPAFMYAWYALPQP